MMFVFYSVLFMASLGEGGFERTAILMGSALIAIVHSGVGND